MVDVIFKFYIEMTKNLNKNMPALAYCVMSVFR